MAKRIQSWEVSDAFWERVNLLIPQPERDRERSYKRIAGGGRKPIPHRRVFEDIVFIILSRGRGYSLLLFLFYEWILLTDIHKPLSPFLNPMLRLGHRFEVEPHIRNIHLDLDRCLIPRRKHRDLPYRESRIRCLSGAADVTFTCHVLAGGSVKKGIGTVPFSVDLGLHVIFYPFLKGLRFCS